MAARDFPYPEVIISRTEAHVPFWVAANRAAKKDPHNNIDHDHRVVPLYKSHRIEEEYEDTVRLPIHTGLFYKDSKGESVEYLRYYTRKVIKTRTRWVQEVIGYTLPVCDYEPNGENRINPWTRGSCSPEWVLPGKNKGKRRRYYWSSGFGHSYKDEKDLYWGGVRAEKRETLSKLKNRYNSGDNLEDEDVYFTYEAEHSLPFWW